MEAHLHSSFVYGVRAEDRVSLRLLDQIVDLIEGDKVERLPTGECIPVYSIPWSTMVRFICATINRYCFLFEYVKCHTGFTYSLPETIVMAIALRGLRFCWGATPIDRESVLWRDRWTRSIRRRGSAGELIRVKTETGGWA